MAGRWVKSGGHNPRRQRASSEKKHVSNNILLARVRRRARCTCLGDRWRRPTIHTTTPAAAMLIGTPPCVVDEKKKAIVEEIFFFHPPLASSSSSSSSSASGGPRGGRRGGGCERGRVSVQQDALDSRTKLRLANTRAEGRGTCHQAARSGSRKMRMRAEAEARGGGEVVARRGGSRAHRHRRRAVRSPGRVQLRRHAALSHVPDGSRHSVANRPSSPISPSEAEWQAAPFISTSSCSP